MTPRIRPSEDGDRQALTALIAQLGYRVSQDGLGDNIREIRTRGGEVLVAEVNDALVGTVTVIVDARLAEGVCAELVSLVVAEGQRGQGFGHHLVRAAEQWARERVTRIRVRANTRRHGAHEFYQRLGYRRLKTQQVLGKAFDPSP